MKYFKSILALGLAASLSHMAFAADEQPVATFDTAELHASISADLERSFDELQLQLQQDMGAMLIAGEADSEEAPQLAKAE
ncbi:hypothetical protein [Shewanella sedimentimangrovi]|uniref:Uncharacterized protein n=1 Tax=Shewanella sedimentimangrovi TaxID=2814293 RepID=A0ABX7R608_9GAMM|nr:hypothetical protein [Shewanella sedimentimangrovi]QSX38225.1 hypothetical protein JYB85_05200 [Shewanella sedimentimangrovi]